MLAELGHALLVGEHPAGTVLVAERLAERYRASRSVIREAVRVLESMGMVTSKRRVGTTVSRRAAWNLFDPRLIRWRLDSPERTEQLRSLSELRRAIEPLAARLAAQRISPEQSDRLRSTVLEMTSTARAGDLDAFLFADVAFHSVILEASGNDMLFDLSSTVAEVLAGRTRHDMMPTRPRDEALSLHQQVAQHVVAGNDDLAHRDMAAIVDEATAAMSTQLTEPPDGGG